MELTELIEAVKAAKDKPELEALVKRELQIDLDKRKSLDTLRAEVLKGLGVEEGDEQGGAGGEPGGAGGTDDQAGAAGDQKPDEATGAGETTGQQSAAELAELQSLRDENAQLREDNAHLLSELQASQIKGQDLEVALQNAQAKAVGGTDLIPPTLDDAGEELDPPAVDGVRLLLNTENGREFAWSPDLAKLPHMKEL